jgi:carbon dioxide concentrating mechanism protein CcmO
LIPHHARLSLTSEISPSRELILENAIGILEVNGFTPAMVALDTMEKSATIHVVQAELNDFLGTVIKIGGNLSDVATAIAAGRQAAEKFGAKPITAILNNPEKSAFEKGIMSVQEKSPLLQQNVVIGPEPENDPTKSKQPRKNMSDTKAMALGFIETQGFTAVFEAIDSACKAANVEVVTKEKLGGGYITVVIRGDVAAVQAAIDVGKSKVEGLGKLIAAHVIPRPSANVLSLLPK